MLVNTPIIIVNFRGIRLTDIFVFINDNILWLQLVMIMVFLILSVVIWQKNQSL